VPDDLQMTVRGIVAIEETARTFKDAVLYIYVEDVGLQDQSSIRLGSLQFNHISHQIGLKTPVSFSIDCVIRDAKSDNIVRAHVSLRGHPEIETGDLLTVQAYPINLPPSMKDVLVIVHEIT